MVFGRILLRVQSLQRRSHFAVANLGQATLLTEIAPMDRNTVTNGQKPVTNGQIGCQPTDTFEKQW